MSHTSAVAIVEAETEQIRRNTNTICVFMNMSLNRTSDV